MEDDFTVSGNDGVLLLADDSETEIPDASESEEIAVSDEAGFIEAVGADTGDDNIMLGESVVIADDAETNALLTSLLEQSIELNETVQLVYDEGHIPLHEVEVNSLGVSDFLLLGIFLVLLAEFILKHLGGIFRCTK